MSIGSFDLQAEAPPLGEPAWPLAVCRYNPDATGDARFAPLPNVVCESVTSRDGAEIPLARFHYLLDDLAAAYGFPTQFEQIWGGASDYTVQPDDRLVVLTWTPTGQRIVLFDGFAQIPQVDLASQSQSASFVAVGVAARCWDVPIGGRRERDANTPEVAGYVQTDLPTRFNPADGKDGTIGNCTPADYDQDAAGGVAAYPVFMDPKVQRATDPPRYWTLSGAVRYLMVVGSAATGSDWVTLPDFRPLDALLKSRYPNPDADFLDPADPDTYVDMDILVRDYDATNKPWPEAVGQLLAYSGFGMKFRSSTDESGMPATQLEVYRLDADSLRPHDVYLDKTGEAIDLARNNLLQVHLARDLNTVVNAFSVETPPRALECAIVLAPGFQPAAGDEVASDGTRSTFLKSRLAEATAVNRRKYRWYIADEAGEGHWDADAQAETPSPGWVTTPIDLAPLYPDDSKGRKTYVRRLRPGRKTLVTQDAQGHPRTATLWYSQDYTGDVPGVWDGTGTWAELKDWKLLEDRLGIECTAEDPEQWNAGKGKPDLRGITWQANPPAGKAFVLRLDTVLADDIMLPSVVPARAASPTQYERRRRVDARDHFRLEEVHESSPHYVGEVTLANSGHEAIRDDTDQALAHARALRAAHEFPPLAGSVTLPGIVTSIQVGDRVRSIVGRDVSLQQNAGTAQDEAPRYPVVVSVTWNFQGGQTTSLSLSDRRAEVQKA